MLVGDELMLSVPEHLVARLGAEVGDGFHASMCGGVLIYRACASAVVVVGDGKNRVVTIPGNRTMNASERSMPSLNTWDF